MSLADWAKAHKVEAGSVAIGVVVLLLVGCGVIVILINRKRKGDDTLPATVPQSAVGWRRSRKLKI